MFVQDTIHLAVKLKSRLLIPNVVLKMGPTCEAGAYHLQPYMQNLARKNTFYGKKRCDRICKKIPFPHI